MKTNNKVEKINLKRLFELKGLLFAPAITPKKVSDNALKLSQRFKNTEQEEKFFT